VNLIPNVTDPALKSLLAKLTARGWLEKVIETPAIGTTMRHLNFVFTLKGQMCLLIHKQKLKQSLYWNESQALDRSLNEQEEAHFHKIILSGVPDVRPFNPVDNP
jgi:hypothetical protein